MTMLAINRFALDGFNIEPSLNGDRLVLRLSGTGDMAAVRHLERCLKQAHAEVVRHGLKAVDIDIRALYLLNSSCLKSSASFV